MNVYQKGAHIVRLRVRFANPDGIITTDLIDTTGQPVFRTRLSRQLEMIVS